MFKIVEKKFFLAPPPKVRWNFFRPPQIRVEIFSPPPKFLGFLRLHRKFYAPYTPSLLPIIPFSSQVCLVCYVSSLASCVSRVMWLNMSCSLSYGPCTLHIFNRYWYLNHLISRCSAFSFSLQHWHSPSELLIQANRVSLLNHPKGFFRSCIGYDAFVVNLLLIMVWYRYKSGFQKVGILNFDFFAK